MTLIVRPARRAWSLLALALAVSACDSADPTGPIATAAPAPVAHSAPSFSSAFRGGIPIGSFHQPTTAYGTTYNGALRNIYPGDLLSHLADIKARGGKVVLNLVGAESRYKDAAGEFSMAMWKASIDRFKNTNFKSYIDDGTVVAAFLMDEPHNKTRWNGKVVSHATIEEMAKYSKARYPNLPTVIRAYPTWLALYSGTYRYLDAAWIQYVHRFGDVGDFTRTNVAKAQEKGLATIVGLNVLRGGTDKNEMTPSQVESFGTVLLTASPCAFISWQYDAKYAGRSDIKKAMAALADKAQNRSAKSCRGSNGQTGTEPSEPPDPEPADPEPEDPEPEEPAPPPPPPPPPPAPPAPPGRVIELKVNGQSEKNRRHYILLTWSGLTGSTVDLYREGKLRRNLGNSGRAKVVVIPGRTYTFKICEKGTSKCSKVETAKAK